MSLTLQSGADLRSLRDWGIEESTVLLSCRSFEADTLSFSVAKADALAVQPFAYAQEIRLLKDGVIIFIGTIRDLPVFGAASAERQRFTAYNFWHQLEAWIYRQFRNIIDEEFANLGLVATSQIILARNPANGAKRSNTSEIAALCAYAGIPVTLDFTGVNPPFEQCTDLPIATGIRRMASWQPDLVGRAVYTTGTPSLLITDRANADTHALDLTAADQIQSIEAKIRYDLKPAGVEIKFITTEVNPATQVRYLRVNTDTGGAPTAGPYTIVCTLNIGDGEAVPYGVAGAYFNGLSVPFIEGSISLSADDFDPSWVPGQLIEFSNAPAAWADAVAPITEVIHDIGGGNTTISFGPPQFLPLASFAALNARMKQTRPDPTKPPEGPGDGTDGTDGGNGGTHDTGKAGATSSGGAPQIQPITHCVGGTQITTLVQRA